MATSVSSKIVPLQVQAEGIGNIQLAEEEGLGKRCSCDIQNGRARNIAINVNDLFSRYVEELDDLNSQEGKTFRFEITNREIRILSGTELVKTIENEELAQKFINDVAKVRCSCDDKYSKSESSTSSMTTSIESSEGEETIDGDGIIEIKEVEDDSEDSDPRGSLPEPKERSSTWVKAQRPSAASMPGDSLGKEAEKAEAIEGSRVSGDLHRKDESSDSNFDDPLPSEVGSIDRVVSINDKKREEGVLLRFSVSIFTELEKMFDEDLIGSKEAEKSSGSSASEPPKSPALGSLSAPYVSANIGKDGTISSLPSEPVSPSQITSVELPVLEEKSRKKPSDCVRSRVGGISGRFRRGWENLWHPPKEKKKEEHIGNSSTGNIGDNDL